MEIVRNIVGTELGPSATFTGTVYRDPVMRPTGAWRVDVAHVHFAPGARTAWHSHPCGQTLWVTEGVGLCQLRGGPIEVIRPGDRVFIEAGEEHWHGAAPTRFMAHLAIQPAGDDGSYATWGDHVSDDEYGLAPEIGA